MHIPTELFVLIGAASCYGAWRLFSASQAAERKASRGLLLFRFAVSGAADRQRILDEESKRWAYWDRRCLVITRYWRKRRDHSILQTSLGRWLYKVEIEHRKPSMADLVAHDHPAWRDKQRFGHLLFTLKFSPNHPAWKTRQQSKSLIDAYLAIERNDPFHDLEHHWHR